jgi:hypothetical protein
MDGPGRGRDSGSDVRRSLDFNLPPVSGGGSAIESRRGRRNEMEFINPRKPGKIR